MLWCECVTHADNIAPSLMKLQWLGVARFRAFHRKNHARTSIFFNKTEPHATSRDVIPIILVTLLAGFPSSAGVFFNKTERS